MSKPKAFVSKTKIKELKTLKKLIKEYPVVGVIDITSLPSSQFQAMKHKLRERLMIRVSKKRVLRILFQDTAKDKAGIDKLVEALDKGIPAVMFSKDIVMTNNLFQYNWGTASYGLLLKEIYDAEISNNTFIQNTIGINAEGSTRVNYFNNIHNINNSFLIKFISIPVFA